MATFPALTPSSRTFTPGRHPHSEIPTLDGLQTRVRTSNVILEQRLRISFIGLTEAEMLSIRTHYVNQQGRFLSFDIPSSLLSGMTTPAYFTPTGYSWLYAGAPQVEDIPCAQRYNVSIELVTVPPEGASVNGAEFTIGAGFIAGPASIVIVTVTATFAAGAADGGASNAFTWDNPDTGNPPANSYRLYGTIFSGYSRLSTTTHTGYKKDELLAGLTLGRSITVLAKGVTHTGTVSTAGTLDDAGTSTERINVFFNVTPTFPDTALGDGAMTLTLL
jgi:hypothetical protein